MKTIQRALAINAILLAGFMAAPVSICRAQILVGGATNQPESLAPLPSVPSHGTFWSAQLKFPPSPFDPLPQLPVFVYGTVTNQDFVVDDRNWDYASNGIPMAASANLGAGTVSAHNGGIHAMDDTGPPMPGGGSQGTNSSVGTSYPMQVFTTNDLWLEIIKVTNLTAVLVIHPPWNVTNGVYDLFYTTNVATTNSWQFVLRTAPGQTNLFPTNATDAQGFYRIGLINPSAGIDFWVTFMDTLANGLGDQYTIYISSMETCTGTVTIPVNGFSGEFITNSFSLTAGTGTNLAIPRYFVFPDYDAIVFYGIHITASEPVSVYGLCDCLALRWSITGFPTTTLGTNYCVMARPSLDTDNYTYSQFAILGTASNTTVTILPSATANLVTNTGSNSFTITLQPGWTYKINSANSTNDVTGTWISSDKPIAVFAGASCAFVPDASDGPGNPLVQELLPVTAWGKQALTRSFGRPGGDSYRVLAVISNTVVTTNGTMATTLAAGQFYDAVLDGPVEFQANNPIQVAQFAQGGFTDTGVYSYGFGDPCEILLPPTGDYLTSYSIAVPDYLDFEGNPFENFLNLIVEQSAIPTTFVDGSQVAATNFVQVASTIYYAARIAVAAGAHKVNSSQPIEVEVYGFGGDDAYSYIGGATVFP